MTTVTIEEAKDRLSELIHHLNPGEEIVITQDDRPVARLVPAVQPARKTRKFGALKGTVLSMDRFDDPLDDFEDYM